MTGLAPGRYCLAVCYCGECPHWKPYVLTDAQRRRLFHYLTRPPRYENNHPTAPRYMADPTGGRR